MYKDTILDSNKFSAYNSSNVLGTGDGVTNNGAQSGNNLRSSFNAPDAVVCLPMPFRYEQFSDSDLGPQGTQGTQGAQGASPQGTKSSRHTGSG